MHHRQLPNWIPLFACLLVCLLGPPTNADWPQLRGPQVNGRASSSSLISRTNDVGFELVWKKPLGSGYSSVSTSAGRAVTAYCDRESSYLVCFGIESGQQLWKVRLGDATVGKNGAHNGPIATPAIGFGNAYMLTPRGQMVAVRMSDGKTIWKRNAVELGGEPFYYGFGSSPIISPDRDQPTVWFQLGGSAGLISAVDAMKGTVRWSYGDDIAGYQTPVPATINGRPSVLVSGGKTFSIVDRQTHQATASMEHGGDGGRGAWSLAAVPMSNGSIFLAHDDLRSKLVQLMGSQLDQAWESNSIRNSYNVPIFYDDHLFAFSSRTLTCIDRKGKMCWKTRKPGDGYFSEVDGHLITLTKSGRLHLIEANPKRYRDKASLQVFQNDAWSVPAIDGDYIFVRSMNEIACVKLVAKAPAKPNIAQNKSPNSSTAIVRPAPGFQRFLDQVDALPAVAKQKHVNEYLQGIPSAPLIENGTVHFLLQGDYQDVAVGGDLFGARQERPMKKLAGTNLFYLAARVSEGARLSYVFVADFKTIIDPRNPNRTASSLLAEDLELQVLVDSPPIKLSWFDVPSTAAINGDGAKPSIGKPADRPERDASTLDLARFSFPSKSMGTRIQVSVLRPPGTDQKALPVVFIHGADLAIKYGELDTLIDGWLKREKREAVVVLIHYAFDASAGASGYETMFGKELLPQLDRNFVLSKDRKQCSSLAAGFDGVLGLSASLANRKRIGRIGLIGLHHFHVHRKTIAASNERPGPPCDIFMRWGKNELRNPDENWNMAKLAQEVADYLQQQGHSVNVEKNQDGSDWICWKKQVPAILNHLLRD